MEGPRNYPRYASKAVREACTDTPVIVIQGARQVGKSTLASLMAGEVNGAVSVTLDDPATLAFAESDPVSFVDRPETAYWLSMRPNEHLASSCP